MNKHDNPYKDSNISEFVEHIFFLNWGAPLDFHSQLFGLQNKAVWFHIPLKLDEKHFWHKQLMGRSPIEFRPSARKLSPARKKSHYHHL